MEAETRSAEQRELIRLQHEEAERRRRSWEQAMERAKARHTESHRAKVLASQVKSWRQATAIRAYCLAIEQAHPGDAITGEWVAWARAHADRIDPLDPAPVLPDPPTNVKVEELEPFLEGWSAYGPDRTRGRWG